MLTAAWVAVKVGAIIFVAGMLFAWMLRPVDAIWIRKRAVPIAVGLFVFGMIAPNLWIMYAALIAIIPVLARTRTEAAAIYLVAMLSAPRLPSPIGIGGAYLFTFDKWVMGAIGLMISFTMLPAQKGLRPRGWFDIPFILVMMLELSQVRGLNFTSALRSEFVLILSVIIPYFLLSRSLRTAEDVRFILLAMCFVGVVQSFVAFFESRTFFLVYSAISHRLGALETISSYTHQRSGMLRAAGSFEEATMFGIFLARALVAALALRDSFRAKRFWIAALLVIAVGLYSTNARGPVLGLIVGIISYDLFRRRYQSLMVKICGSGLLYAIGLLAAQFSSGIAERMGLTESSASTVDYRHLLLTRGMDEILKHPIIGQSFDNVLISLSDLRQGEGLVDFVNGYIFYGMVAGLPGMIMIIACFALTAGKMATIRKRFGRNQRLLEIGGVIFSVAIMTILTCATSGFLGRQDLVFYIVLGLGSAMSTLKLNPNEQLDLDGSPPTDVRKRMPA